MKIFILALLSLMCVVKTYSQTGTRSYHTLVLEITKEKKPKRIYTNVSIDSAFRSRDSSSAESLKNDLNQKISLIMKAKTGKYIVSVRFLIERDGSVADIRCLNDPGFGLCEQVVNVIKRSVLGEWRPSSDTKVREFHKTPTTFPKDTSAYKNHLPM